MALEQLLTSNDIDMVIDNNHYDSDLYEKELYSKERILLAVPKIFDECNKAKEFALSEQCIRTKEYNSEKYPSVPLELFKSVPFIMLTPNNDTRTRGTKICKEAGFRPQIALEVHQQATAYMIATTQMGATFISDTVVEKMPAFDKLDYYKLSSEAAQREVYFYFKKNKYKTRAMREFMNLISQNR